jgi:hypothetical protein
MFFPSTAIILFSVIVASFAAPIQRRATAAGWPFTAGEDGKSFGIDQNVKTGTSSVGTEDGAPALIAEYPKGSYAGATIAGFIFEGDGGSDAGLDNALEAQLSYQVKFQDDFDFVLAGKLPGLCKSYPLVH